MSPAPTPCSRRSLKADWRDVVFLHFAVPPENLAPHVPLPLDLHDSAAYVSLVSFRLERLRPAHNLLRHLGRWLFRPLSESLLLNLRTYVRGPEGDGVFPLCEWIDNPLSVRPGSWLHGLPLRLAHIARTSATSQGLRRIVVHEPASQAIANLLIPAQPDSPPSIAAAGTRDAFLIERYLAYTHHHDICRHFRVHHAPWQAARFSLARYDLTLIEQAFPWFAQARFIGGHVSRGACNVVMEPARRTNAFVRQPSVLNAATSEPAGLPAS